MRCASPDFPALRPAQARDTRGGRACPPLQPDRFGGLPDLVPEEVADVGNLSTTSGGPASTAEIASSADLGGGANLEEVASSSDGGRGPGSVDLDFPETECDFPVSQPWAEKARALSRPGEPRAPVLPAVSWFRVAYLGGIEVRTAPFFEAPRTGAILMQNQIVPVAEETQRADGRLYLRLVDGRGWVFDDSALMPDDPSMVRGHWSGDSLSTTPLLLGLPPAMFPYMGMMPPPYPGLPYGVDGSAAREAPALAEPPVSWFRVAYLGGINLRSGPSVDAPVTGVTIRQMEVIPVAEELPSLDGRVYLRLCDGRGWAFDDSKLMPQDPSVVRGNWVPKQQNLGVTRVADHDGFSNEESTYCGPSVAPSV